MISSNGRHKYQPIYLVVNPVTGKSLALPPPPPRNDTYHMSIGIMCEENTTELAAYYKVVCVVEPLSPKSDNIQQIDIETYSSKTGTWAASTLVATCNVCLDYRSPVVANGVFHWYLGAWSAGIAVYDPNDCENHLQLIHVPTFGLSLNANSCTTTRSPDNFLWYGLTSNVSMQIFKLPKGEDGSYRRKTTIGHEEWVLMYDTDNLPWESIRLEAFIEWKFLVAVIRKDERVYLCDLERNIKKRVLYDGTYCERYDNNLQPYLESLCLSSYAL